MKTIRFATMLLVVATSASCAPAITVPLTTPPEQPLATATNLRLPFNDKDNDHEGCQLPAVQLSVSEAQGSSEDEIAAKLIDLLLTYFIAPDAPDYCRIDDYRIDKVYYDEHTPYSQLEPKGDFMRSVQFSIKLIQVPNMWMSWAGEIDQQNWLHTRNDVAVFHDEDRYTMSFAYP